MNTSRDYSLVGPDGQAAIEKGLANAEWYRFDIPRNQLKELMKRSDGPALRDTALWFAALAVSGGLGAWYWGSWICVPFLFCYGILYGSSSDSRWHECGHGTAFKTVWMNDLVYQVASFMIMRNPTLWRWSHTRHHTDTLIVGRDPEIVAKRPPPLARIGANFFGLIDVPMAFKDMFLHATGRLNDEEATFVPESERPKVFRTARIWLAIYAAVVAACLSSGSVLPAMLVGLPRIYGTWLHVVFGLTQHAGLAEDVLDHRLNSRTVYMNPIFRFLYWNMNYHVEHHVYPSVPYYRLPALHAIMKDDTPPPYKSTIDAYVEIIPALLRQLKEPEWSVQRPLPSGARAVHPVQRQSAEAAPAE